MGTVIVELQGGLGNQMFQYAIGRALSLYQGSELLLDTRALEAPGPQTPRSYALGVFDIRARRATADDLARFGGRGVAEPGPRFHGAVTRLEGDTWLRGYWQCERYFRAIRPVLCRDFTLRREAQPRNLLLARSMRATHSVAVHFRRGDYVTKPEAAAHHGTCSLAYYREALARLRREHGDVHVYAFSDDPAWVREHFSADGALTVVEGNEAIAHEDLWLMRQCRHHVIANSSFSWWGAWLRTTEGGTVIAPQRWVLTPGFDTTDVVPEPWQRIAA